MCVAGGPAQDPPCLDSVETWTDRIGAALAVAIAVTP